MAVAYVDHTYSYDASPGTSPSFEHTCPAGSDRLVLVCIGRYDMTAGATAVSFDSTAMTLLAGAGGTTPPPMPFQPVSRYAQIWYLELGTSGSADTGDVDITYAASGGEHMVAAVNFTGVDQDDPFGATETLVEGAFASGAASVEITTDTADSLLFGHFHCPGEGVQPTAIAQDDSQTERYEYLTDGENNAICGSTLAAATTQAYDFGMTSSGGTDVAAVIIVTEVHEAAAGGTEVSSTRAARTAGKVSDANSTRAARTKGKVTDASTARAARTKGKVTDASTARAARTAGKVTDSSTARAARTKGQPPRDSFYGTVTYFMRGTWGGGGAGDDADHACIPGAFGYKLTKDDAAQAQVKDTVPGTTNDRICFSWTSETPEPPTPWALGDYRAQVDVTYIGPDIVFRIQLLRIKLTDCTVLETLGTSGNLSGTGLHLFSVEGINPGDTGRFQVRLIADNTNEAAQDIRCSVRGTNSWADGPWGYLDSDTRAARTAGKVTDASSTRAARTLGQVTDSSTRAARTAGKVTGASSVRGARAYGKSSAVSSTRAARTVGKVTPVLAQAEPFVPKDIRFSADTAKGLRDELNRVFAEITERFEVRTIVVKGVQFVPVRGPITKAEATPGLMYVREYEYNLDNDDDPLDCVHVVLPDSSETKSLGRIPLEAATVDGDGNSTTGGLRDD